MNVVFANTNAVLAHAGQRVGIRAGEPWDANDPLVQAYPDHFADNLRSVRTTLDPRGFREFEVERATRAPGERRNVRRTAKDTSGE